MPNFLISEINCHTFCIVHHKSQHYWSTLSLLTSLKKEKSYDRDTRKMFYIGESDNDCYYNIGSLPNIVRKRHIKKTI